MEKDSELIQKRKDKFDQLKQNNPQLFPNDFKVSHTINEIHGIIDKTPKAVKEDGPIFNLAGRMMAINRSYAGSGHGWSGAQIVFWNCSAAVIGVQKPPTAQNFAIGYKPSLNAGDEKLREHAVEQMQFFSMLTDPVDGPFWGDGYKESPDAMVQPSSLYEAQLADRKRILSSRECSAN